MPVSSDSTMIGEELGKGDPDPVEMGGCCVAGLAKEEVGKTLASVLVLWGSSKAMFSCFFFTLPNFKLKEKSCFVGFRGLEEGGVDGGVGGHDPRN